MPLAFFCTLFFRHRKKSVSVPWDGQSQSAPESARQAPPRAGQGFAPAGALGAFRSPPVPFGSPPEAIERPIGLQALLSRRSRRVRPRQRGISYGKVVVYRCKQGGFPRGKQSARFALPCVPLVVCLNSGSLTACGGCAHWAHASLRSPQSPSGRSWRKTQRGINIPAEKQGAFRSPPCTPFGPHSARKMRGKQSGKNVGAFIKANNRRANPRREQGFAPAGAQNAFLKSNHQRGPHCRALHRPFAATTRRGCPQKQNPRRRPKPAAGIPFSFRGKSEKPLT